MIHATRMNSCRRLWIAVLTVALAILILTTNILFRASTYGQDDGKVETFLPAVSRKSHPIDRLRVEGEDKCVDCHKSEYRDWLATHHATETFDKLRTNEKSREFAQKLEIPFDSIAKNSLCTQCHATPKVEQGRQGVIPGVSCEACHGASGGQDGWLNLHAVYGPVGTRREAEQPGHYLNRVSRCRESGQNRSADPFRLARACYQCHMVWDEKLVNIAEHPAGNSKGFEFLAWSTGEIRHNYHLDSTQNALISTLWSDPLWRSGGREGTNEEHFRIMYVAGQLAELHVALVNRAHAKNTEVSDFAEAMTSRIEAVRDNLADISDVYAEATDKELTPLLAAVEAADEIEDALDAVDPASAPRLLQAAAQVEAAAAQFVQQFTGSELGFLDPDKEGFLPVIKTDPDEQENNARYTEGYRKRTGGGP